MARSAQHKGQVEPCFDQAQHNAFGAAVIGKDLGCAIVPKQTGERESVQKTAIHKIRKAKKEIKVAIRFDL